MPDPRGQDSRKIRFIDKPGYKTMGVVMWLNVVRVAYPEVKVQVRDLVRVVGIVAPFDPRGGDRYPGKIIFIESQEVNGHRRPVPCVPSSGMPRECQAKFRTGPYGDCRRVL